MDSASQDLSSPAALPASWRLDGRVALVTGASRGIGHACASLLAARGAAVAVNYSRGRDAAEALSRSIVDAGGKAIAVGFDLTDGEACEAGVKRVATELGGLDILVNNGGISIDALLMRADPADLARLLAVNVQGAFACTKAATRYLLKAKNRGRIITLSSVVGERGNSGQSMYAASKAALIGFAKSIALELASRGVTSNVVSPGYIATDMTAAALDDKAQAALLNQIPLGSVGRVEDVAEAVAWLASPSAAYVTGQVIRVNGGMLM